ncbi:MAG TPA: DUF6088 family protein [Longimicrobium sp.]|nr:DUF6088 family protein [Longimicrobium sp.]
MMRDTLASQIQSRIESGAHRVWTASDFLDLGSRDGIDKALQRLSAAGQIRRISRGLYDRPRTSSLTRRPVPPDPSAVIDAVARRDQIRVVVDGITAANDLGLTTAVPAHVVVLTDARLKPIHLGAQTITFKQAAPSRLAWAGRPAMRIVQALYWFHDGLGGADPALRSRLGRVLGDPVHGAAMKEDLAAGLPAMPIWMQKVVRDLIAPARAEGSRPAAARGTRETPETAPGAKPGARSRARKTVVGSTAEADTAEPGTRGSR